MEQQATILGELWGQVAESGSNRMAIIAVVVGLLLGVRIGVGVMIIL